MELGSSCAAEFTVSLAPMTSTRSVSGHDQNDTSAQNEMLNAVKHEQGFATLYQGNRGWSRPSLEQRRTARRLQPTAHSAARAYAQRRGGCRTCTAKQNFTHPLTPKDSWSQETTGKSLTWPEVLAPWFTHVIEEVKRGEEISWSRVYHSNTGSSKDTLRGNG